MLASTRDGRTYLEPAALEYIATCARALVGEWTRVVCGTRVDG